MADNAEHKPEETHEVTDATINNEASFQKKGN